MLSRLGALGAIVVSTGVSTTAFAQAPPPQPGYGQPAYPPAPAPGYGQPAYPQPGYPPGYGYPPRPPAPRDNRPGVISPWDPDEPPPPGYRIRTSVNGGMLAAGITFLSVFWASSAVSAGILAADEDERGIDGNGVEGSDWVPLYIPVVGPFATVASVEPEAGGAALLIIDGLIQTMGLGLILGGALDTQTRAVKRVSAAPIITPQFRGFGMHASF